MKRLTAIAPFLPLLLIWTGCDDDEPIIDEALLDVTWIADSLRTPSETTVVMGDSIWYEIRDDSKTASIKYVPVGSWYDIIIRFGREGELSAVICNDGGWQYEIEPAGIISIIGETGHWTEQACPGWLIIEELLTDVIENVTRYEVTGDKLELRGQDGSYYAILAAEQ